VVYEIVRYWVEPGQAEAFLEACRDARSALRGTPHCLSFELSRCLTMPEEFLLIIGWDSIDLGREEFVESRALDSFRSHERPFSAEILETLRYEPVRLRFSRVA
jgi:quinol monooxygenase YgiN